MQHLELAYLAVAYGMAGIMFYATRQKTFSTVSHIALDRRLTRQVFFWGLAISALIFAILMYGWLIPLHGLGLAAKILTTFIVVCQICTGFFPVNEKKFGGAHTIFASSLGAGMFALIITFTISDTISPLARAMCGLLATGMVVLLATSVRVPRGEYLFHEKTLFTTSNTSDACGDYSPGPNR